MGREIKGKDICLGKGYMFRKIKEKNENATTHPLPRTVIRVAYRLSVQGCIPHLALCRVRECRYLHTGYYV